ncbi:ComEC family competence protein [Pseudomonas sp. R2.Fl]|nr:ComEC family competence protein [Pseudomonas sp. R2.Fl]
MDETAGRAGDGRAAGADVGDGAPSAAGARLRRRVPRSLLRLPSLETVRAAWQEESDHGHLFLFVPVLLGVGSSLWFSLDDPPPVFVIAIAAAVLLLAATRRGGTGGIVASGFALVLCGVLLAEGQIRRDTAVLLDTPVTTRLTGIVEEREVGPAGDWRYIVSVATTVEPRLKRPPAMVSLTTRAGHEPFSIGETVAGRARLSPPSGPALPGTFDFAFGSYFRGIGAVGYFVGAPERVASGDVATEGWRLVASRWLRALRTGATDRIRDVIGGDAGAFAAAVITGERRGMSEEAVEALRISGLAHIISISGLHMALAAGLFFVGMRVMLSLSVGLNHAVPVKKVAAFGALLAATAYLMISGGQVSAVRAYVMMAVMLVAVLLDRPAISLRNLAIAALAIVVIEPSEVVGPSFQMSFAATAALIAGYAAWRDNRPDDGFLPEDLLPKPARYLLALFGGILLSSLIGGLSTAAFAIDYFHRFGVYSMPANLAAMPVVSFIVMPMALIAMILMPFGLDYLPLVVLGFGLDIVIALAREVASWGGDGGIERLPDWFLPCFVAGFVLLTLLRTRLRHAGTAIIAAAIGAAVLLPSPRAGALLVSEDGMLVGLTGDRSIATNRTRPPGFVFSQWQEALQRHEHRAPLDRPQPELTAEFKAAREARLTPDGLVGRAGGLMREIATDLPQGRFSCAGRLFCLGRLGETMIVATVEETALIGSACDIADLVVTPRRPAFRRCRSGALLVSAEDLRLTGALELWPEEGEERRFRVRTALGGALRPWHLHRRYDWRTDDYDRTPAADVLERISGSGG